MLKIYQYKNCGTCKKALKFLDNKNIDYQKIEIRETTPSKKELKKMLEFLKNSGQKQQRIFNSSGRDYRSMNLKDNTNSMSEIEIIELLHSNGNLIKRPFLIGEDIIMIGFKEVDWNNLKF